MLCLPDLQKATASPKAKYRNKLPASSAKPFTHTTALLTMGGRVVPSNALPMRGARPSPCSGAASSAASAPGASAADSSSGAPPGPPSRRSRGSDQYSPVYTCTKTHAFRQLRMMRQQHRKASVLGGEAQGVQAYQLV